MTLGIGIALVGWLIALAHLRIFDPLYLAYGSRDKFHPGTSPP